ncbi:MAG: penicillin acylase family protein [Myxococcales bacterium]|nr:penicillin acylase family protein [Myxococcales bacterium]MCB9731696.1 penicillin acylase family protein [Deltaproteobacteria bacterium]
MPLLKSLLRLFLGKRLPHLDGELAVAGLEAPARIRRDRLGVVYIDAQTTHDAWWALGFCHGQDRAGQLEIYHRVLHGRLAAVAGRDGLPMDQLSRRLGVRRAAEAQLAAADEDVKAQLAAYADGVNAGIARGGKKVAHDLTLLGTKPSRWTAADVQGMCGLVTFALAANWDIELARLRVLEKHGPDVVRALDPSTPDWLHATSPPGTAAGVVADRLAADLELLRELTGTGGSNAWAVAPRRSATGRPILASDPHLIPTAPTQWYLASLRTPEWAATGATFVGIAAVGVGHNGTAAWGVTAAHMDIADLFIEEVGPDGASVRDGDGFVPCEVLREIIGVKGQKEHVETVLVTPRGPIVSPSLGGPGPALSLSATYLSGRPYRGLLKIHEAKTPADFHALFEQASTTNTGVVYATTAGDIGWLVAGEVPIRRSGAAVLPLPGWDPRVGWDGLVPHEALPRELNPAAGYVVTANNAPRAGAEGPWLGDDWLDGYRATAIGLALAARDDWDLPATIALQTAVTSLPWRELRAIVLAAPRPDADAERAAVLLEAWDGEVAADSIGASVYAHFVAAAIGRVVRGLAPEAAERALGMGDSKLLPHNLLFARRTSQLVRLLRTQPPGYLPEPWPEVVGLALADAVRALRKRRGKKEARWAWADVRPLELMHPFGDQRPLDRVFNVKRIRTGGDATTVSQAAVDLRNPSGNPIGVPTLRAVFDVGAWDEARVVLLGGQSGNPWSAHYADHVPLWERGETHPLPWSEAAIAAATVHTLALSPAPDA